MAIAYAPRNGGARSGGGGTIGIKRQASGVGGEWRR